MDKSIKLIDIFNKESIQKRAKEYWDCKDEQCKVKCGNRYNHIFENKIGVSYTWNKSFDFLSKPQQTIIIKGELIRTYDALPNIDKTVTAIPIAIPIPLRTVSMISSTLF